MARKQNLYSVEVIHADYVQTHSFYVKAATSEQAKKKVALRYPAPYTLGTVKAGDPKIYAALRA